MNNHHEKIITLNRRSVFGKATRLTAAMVGLSGGSALLGQDKTEIRRRGAGKRIRVLAGVMEWRLTPAETGDTYFILETLVNPGGGVPPHKHAEQEGFYVLDGEVEYGWVPDGKQQPEKKDLQWSVARLGDSVQIPGHAWHGWRCTGTRAARILVTGPGRLGRFFEEAGVAYTASGSPGQPTAEEIKRVSNVMAKFGHEFMR